MALTNVLGQEITVDEINQLSHKLLDLLSSMNVTSAKFVLNQALTFIDDRSYVTLQKDETLNHHTVD